MAVSNMAVHLLGYAIAIAIGSVKYFDVTEDIGYWGSIYAVHASLDAPSPRQHLVFGCALLWNTRLLAFLGYRIVRRGSDWRFDKLNLAYAYQLFGWTSGGTWCWANGFCLWHAADADQSAPLGALDACGVLIFALGLTIECVADVQKYRFNARHKVGTNKRWIDTGLWSRSRHPNYFGETTLWTGLALVCMSGRPSLYAVGVCLVTPLWSFVFLLFTSLMLLEKRADLTYGHLADYRRYKATTPVWLPRLS